MNPLLGLRQALYRAEARHEQGFNRSGGPGRAHLESRSSRHRLSDGKSRPRRRTSRFPSRDFNRPRAGCLQFTASISVIATLSVEHRGAS
jgi:hypothetical protein